MIRQHFISLGQIKEIPAHHRVWVYQSNRFFNDDENRNILESGAQFVKTWAAHGTPLHGGVLTVENLFVIIHIDEQLAQASGCSIDKSVKWLMEMGKRLGIDFMDRGLISWMNDEGKICLEKMSEFEKQVKSKVIKPDTYVFNNLVFSGKEIHENWCIALSDSWHKRFLS
jgi:hypothetical protein